MPTIEKAAKDLDDLIAIQCADGNWNYDEYMFGMANGLLLARSLLDGSDPVFLTKPDRWLCDLPSSPAGFTQGDQA